MIHIIFKLRYEIKTKGFTLIELLIALSIASLVFLASISMIGSYKRIKNDADYIGCSNSILNFIQSAKDYCRNNYAEGRIYVDESGILCFIANNTMIKKFKIPEGFNSLYIDSSSDNKIIKINEAGLLVSAGHISYKDRKGKECKIVIWVSTFCYDIQE